MSKTVDCPVKGFSGSVVFHDPLTYPILVKYEESVDAAKSLVNEGSILKIRKAMLPGILECVEEWKLDSGKSFTVENFPATPKIAAAKFLEWLVEQIVCIINDDDPDPNE